jgi:serine/threonine protein phosphatase 1
MKLLGLFSRASRPAAFIPGRVGYAVGDIHGRADLLNKLLTELEAVAGGEMRPDGVPIIVFLGDYVDRGPDARGVLDMLLSGRPQGYERRFLRGNHEQSMAAFMEAPLENRAWLLQGGAETLISYGVTPPAPIQASEDEWREVALKLAQNLPEAHKAFLDQLERYVELGGYAFVHAGVNPARPLDRQSDDDLYWARQAFLNSRRRFSHRVVHGHTPSQAPYADARRVGVDTGAYASGVLTAARFEGDQVSFVSVSDRPAPPQG